MSGGAPSPRAGFALITVLFALLVITALLTAATQSGMSHARAVATEREVLLVRHRAAARARLAMAALAGPPEAAGDALGALGLRAQDVGGLVDLNTGAPPLVARVLSGPDMPPGAMAAFTAWRRQDRRLQRVSDLTWIAGLSPAAAERVARVATVHSGRTGVAPKAAPGAVLALFGPGGVPPEARSAPSGVTFDLFEADAPEGAPPLATITLEAGGAGEGGTGAAGRILSLR